MTDIGDKIITARVGLLLKHSFFGNMATRLQTREVEGNWCKTAATDGRVFYYDPEFINKCDNKMVEFVFAHEVLHCALLHLARMGDNHNKKLANIAMDYAVNQILVDERIGTPPASIKIFQDGKYRNMGWEQIYELLLKDPEFQHGEGSTKGELMDVHVDGSIGEGEGEDSNKPVIDEQTAAVIQSEIREAMINAAAAADKLPGAIKRMVDELIAPKISWKDLIQQNIQALVRSDYSFMRPNRRSAHSQFVLPGLIPQEQIQVAVAVDMSGSIDKRTATAFLSEVKGMMDQYAEYKIDLWCFDTRIHNPVTITNDDPDAIYEYDVKGGGGTSFDVNFTYMKDNNIEPKLFIMFTDMYPCGSWGDPDYCPTIFVSKGNENAVAPYGQTVVYEHQ